MTDRAGWLRRALGVGATAALVATGLAACGGDDDQTIAIEVTEKGKTPEITGAPESVEAGEVDIELTNNGKQSHDLQLIRVEGDHSAADTIKAFGAASQGKPYPDWFFGGGGTPPVEPGQGTTVTQVLEPGTYYALDLQGSDGSPDPKTVPAIEVTGEQSDAELPETDATIRTIDYGFEASGELTAGSNEITFENAGAQPHHILAAPLKPGKSLADVRKALKTNQGPPPIDEKSQVATSVLEGGDSQVVTLDLKKQGKYALVCFISDRQGGPPHAIADGMFGEAVVK